MAGSVVVAVRKALVAGIRTAVNDPKVHVSYGWEGGDESSRREQIFTDRPRATHDPAALKPGRNFREEDMELDLVVRVAGVGKSPEQTDERAIALGLLVEEFIADRKAGETLNVDGLIWLRVSRMELNNRYAPNGSLSEITYTLRYHARLT